MQRADLSPEHNTIVTMPPKTDGKARLGVLLSLISSLVLWSEAPVPPPARTSVPRLVACTAPAPSALAFLPCPQPDPGEPTNLLGSCPDVASCGTLNLFLTTWTFYALLAFGCLCALWVLWTAVQAASPVGSIRQEDALRLVGRNFLIACFAFLVAWNLQRLFVQLETLLLAAQRDAGVLPWQTLVYLFEVALAFLVQVSAGAVLLSLLLTLLTAVFAVAGSDARTLALSWQRLGWMLFLLGVILVAPILLSRGAQVLTGGF